MLTGYAVLMKIMQRRIKKKSKAIYRMCHGSQSYVLKSIVLLWDMTPSRYTIEPGSLYG